MSTETEGHAGLDESLAACGEWIANLPRERLLDAQDDGLAIDCPHGYDLVRNVGLERASDLLAMRVRRELFRRAAPSGGER